jgi:hypothetical protein
VTVRINIPYKSKRRTHRSDDTGPKAGVVVVAFTRVVAK